MNYHLSIEMSKKRESLFSIWWVKGEEPQELGEESITQLLV
jgi:hypothetical protein